MKWFLGGAAGLHAFFMLSELFPWSFPLILRIATKKLPSTETFTAAQRTFVATLVHNAGIYNGIVAAGLAWAAVGGYSTAEVARIMLLGATFAGIFGTLTLKSPLTAVQAIVGIIGLILVQK